MRLALNEAQKALKQQEVPIGAVVVAGGAVIGRGHNLVETLADPTAHAEMQLLKSSCISASLASIHGRCRDARGQVFAGVHALRHGRAVHHVRRGDRMGAGEPRGVGRRRSQEGLPALLRGGVPPQDDRGAGGAPGGVRGVDERFFRGFARIDLVKKEFFLYFCIQRVSDRGA